MLDGMLGEQCALVADGDVDIVDVRTDAVDAVGDQCRLQIGHHCLRQIGRRRHHPEAPPGGEDHRVADALHQISSVGRRIIDDRQHFRLA
jgi:hypothetical protein